MSVALRGLLRQLLADAYAYELAFVKDLTPVERAATGTYEMWSARDLLAHNADWKQWAADRLAAMRGSGTLQDYDLEAANKRIFAAHADESWDELLALMAGAQAALVGQLDQLTEDELAGVGPLFTGNGYGHPLGHLVDAYRARGDIEHEDALMAALGEQMEALDPGDVWQGTLAYNQVCSAALQGKVEEALEWLRRALHLNPPLVAWSREDPDLASLRDLDEYAAIYAALE
jgi:hypothetical protein